MASTTSRPLERVPRVPDQYITAARQVAKLAIGSPNPRVSNVKYSIAANQNPDEPLPLGTRGGIKFKHNFPADGEYRITIDDLNVGLYTNAVENREHAGDHDRRQDRVPQADRRACGSGSRGSQGSRGTRRDHGAFREDSRPGRSRRARRRRGVHRPFPRGVRRKCRRPRSLRRPDWHCRIWASQQTASPAFDDGIEITGPYNPKGVSRTPSRALIFVCDPNRQKSPPAPNRSPKTSRAARSAGR